ncbi:MAG TPA: NADH-ubiquinone oxidoreductase-F iron-sulfur binding region domain-containing protein [Actinomycetota bacterium]|nr:NADH-ubiquinone oxidoreductase-F iron-sulfur binding region domain-containing protein [Actinomycetota bacterium]
MPAEQKNGRPGTILLTDDPVESIDEYVERGGGLGLAAARDRSPDEVIEEVRRSGLRGRGGGGFPTGIKWRTVRDDPSGTKFVVCNAAEGEPGTFKDRWLLRANPYQVVEGLGIAAYAVGAERAFIGIKTAFEQEIERLRVAMEEMAERDLIGPVAVELTPGPDEYLFGEEKALLEVIEGNEPLPRVVPPWMEGLFRSPDSPNPTVVNNVETLANVPHILRRGAEWFRSFGTDESPGTMVFTLCGDVRHPGMYELPLGFSLRDLIYGIGGGPRESRQLKAVFPGASNTIISAEQLDAPLAFETMRAVGTGLGSGGFVVYDDTACIVRATLAFSRFLYVESCAQCPACKHGTGAITQLLERIDRGDGTAADVETILARALTVTDAQRCALPTGETLIAQSAVQVFGHEFEEHLGRPCPRRRDLLVPRIVDFDDRAGDFVYDERYPLKQPDWTYADEPSA